MTLILALGLGAFAAMGSSPKPQWIELCRAQAILDSDRDYQTHSPEVLDDQIDRSSKSILKLGESRHWTTIVYARRGHIAEARKRMIEIAKKYGYVLLFSQTDKFDPRAHLKPKTVKTAH